MRTYLVPKLLLPLMSAKLFLIVTPSKLGPKSWWKLGTRSFAATNSSAGTPLQPENQCNTEFCAVLWVTQYHGPQEHVLL